jgi:hypothetical protein
MFAHGSKFGKREGDLPMITHEIWIEGSASPLVLELEDDELFQLFKKWIERDQESSPYGWTGTFEGKTWMINFSQVACIATKLKENRRTMGFGP